MDKLKELKQKAKDYKAFKTEKKFSTIESENTPSNATYVLMEFNNQKEFGVLKVLFDDNSKKILNIKVFL
jgi:5,10-methylene-tetrahydrofolate dehydrogenase/methenyl tetrahydrofolate cyclohydrolase